MPSQTATPPPGVTFDSAPVPQATATPSGAAQNGAPPPGVTFDATPVTAPQANEHPAPAKSTAGGLFQGFSEGVHSSVLGIDNIINKGSNALGLGDAIDSKDIEHEKYLSSDTGDGMAQKIGYGGESLLEFLGGDKALKSLSIPEKLSTMAESWKTLEKSPKLLNALRLGAAAMKAGAKLSPEEAAIIDKYPRIAKLISMGVEAGHAATTQGVQTTVRTGGDVKQGLADAAVTAATAGTLHAVGSAAGSVLKKGAQAAQAAQRVGQVAQEAASKPEVLDAIKNRINTAENALHENYESGINDIKDRLSGAEVPASDNPLADKAKDILSDPPPGTHPAVAAAKKASRDTLDKPVQQLLERIANGDMPMTDEELAAQEEAHAAANKPSGLLDANGKPIETPGAANEEELPTTKEAPPYKINDLISLRQEIRKAAENYEYGSYNSRALRSLLNSVDEHGNFSSPMDDTIQKLAEDSGDDTAVKDYKDLRANYRDNISNYDDPVIKAIREDKIDDAAKAFVGTIRQGSALPSAGKVAQNLDTLKAIVGEPGMKAFGKNVLGTILKDSQVGEAQTFNPDRFISTWNRIDPATKETLFGIKPNGFIGPDDQAAAGLKNVLKDAKSAKNLQTINRYLTALGVGSATGGTALTAHLPILSGIGLLGATGGSLAYGRELLDYVANHPNTIKAYIAAGKVADNAAVKAVGKTAAKVAGSAVANAVSPDRGPESVEKEVVPEDDTTGQQQVMLPVTRNLSGK